MEQAAFVLGLMEGVGVKEGLSRGPLSGFLLAGQLRAEVFSVILCVALELLP